MVAFLDIVGPELNKPYNSSTVKGDAAPQLKHLLRQALLSCSGGVRLDEEVNGPMQLLDIQVNKSAGEARCAPRVRVFVRPLHTHICRKWDAPTATTRLVTDWVMLHLYACYLSAMAVL